MTNEERELCLEGHRWFDLRRYTVDSRYPFSKEIVHYYTDFNSKNVDPSTGLKYQTFRYVLEKNDPAYTLALPKEVTDFQNTLPSVERPERFGTVYNEYEGIDMEALGRNDGYQGGLEIGKMVKKEGRILMILIKILVIAFIRIKNMLFLLHMPKRMQEVLKPDILKVRTS